MSKSAQGPEQAERTRKARTLVKAFLRPRVLSGQTLEYLGRCSGDGQRGREHAFQMGGFLWPDGADVSDPGVRPLRLTCWQIGVLRLDGAPCSEIFSVRDLFAEISIEEATWQGNIYAMTTKDLAGRLRCSEAVVRGILERLLAGQSDDTRLLPCASPKGVVIADGRIFTSTVYLPDGHPLKEPGERWVVLTRGEHHRGAESQAQGAGESGRNAK